MKENDILSGEQGALKRALYKSMGFSDSQLRTSNCHCKQLYQRYPRPLYTQPAVRTGKSGDSGRWWDTYGIFYSGPLRRYS